MRPGNAGPPGGMPPQAQGAPMGGPPGGMPPQAQGQPMGGPPQGMPPQGMPPQGQPPQQQPPQPPQFPAQADLQAQQMIARMMRQ